MSPTLAERRATATDTEATFDEVIGSVTHAPRTDFTTRPAGIGARGRLHRIPPEWTFASRFDVGSWCRHDPEWVVIVGNVDTLKIWRCTGCLNQVVPVFPGWVWSVREQRHIHLATQAARAALGHPSHYTEAR